METFDGSHGPNLSAHDRARNLKRVNCRFCWASAGVTRGKSDKAMLLPK